MTIHLPGLGAIAVPSWAALVAVAAGVLALCCAVRAGRLASVLRGIAIPLVLLYEAQGLYLLTIQRMHAPRDLAYVLAGVTTAVVLTFGAYAHEHHKRHGSLGPNGRRMWWVAVPMGLVVALSAGSVAAFGLRLVLPLLSVAAFQSAYLPDEPDGERRAKRGTWRWTPRRLAVAIGAIDPTDADLASVHAERDVRRLVSHGLGYHDGPRVLRAWHGKRLARCLRLADDDMVTEARQRAARVRQGLALDSAAIMRATTRRATQASPVPGASANPGATEATPNGIPGASAPKAIAHANGTHPILRDLGTDRYGEARARYLTSVAAGSPLSDRALANEFGRSRTWGAKRIKEAQATDPAEAGAKEG